MTKRRQWLGRAGVLFCALCASAACGSDEEPDIFAPDTFAGMHQEKVVYACQQTVACRQMQNRQLPANPERSCQEQTVQQFEREPESQEGFLNNHANCQNLTACAYESCSLTDAVSFGRSQMMNVMYACQQYVDCEVQAGRLPNDPMYVTMCVSDEVAGLDAMTSSGQGQWRDTYQTCRTLAGCEFADCLWPAQ